MNRILVVEDSEDTQLLVKKALGESYQLTFASSKAEAEREIAAMNFDLVLMDIQLPDGDGLKLVASLKEKLNMDDLPVLFLSAQRETSQKLIAFSLGAEDYIEKPFNLAELSARVESRLKKSARKKQSSEILVIEDLRFYVPYQRVCLIMNNKEEEIALTPLEFKLLHYLAKNQGRVYSRDQILDAVWGRNLNVTDRTVDTHVSNLRKKLKQSVFTIRSVHGVGYSLAHERGTANAA